MASFDGVDLARSSNVFALSLNKLNPVRDFVRKLYNVYVKNHWICIKKFDSRRSKENLLNIHVSVCYILKHLEDREV